MKYRNGFVTNSSSTSFIISIKSEFSKESFMSGIGADGESPMNVIFEDLFDAIDMNKQPIQDAAKNNGGVEMLLKKDGYSSETISQVLKLISEGREVYYGELASDGSTPAEIYFCCESFILCEDDIYFIGNIGGW